MGRQCAVIAVRSDIMFRLDGKIAVVTGAASGIGKAIATVLARQGAHTHLFDREELAAKQLARKLGDEGLQATAHRCDVTSKDSVIESFRAVHSASGSLDILVNNAGIAHIGTVETTTEADFERVYAVNVKGVFLCLQAGLPYLLASSGGAIVNIASTASLTGIRDRFAYSMSKGAVHTMTLSVAADYVDKGIRCNCVCPARVHTPFVDGYVAEHYPDSQAEMFQRLSRSQPLGRMGQPSEIAALVLYLCSDESAFTTGAAYPIDGGTTSLIWGAEVTTP